MDDADFQMLASLNAISEYRKRFEVFLSALPLEEPLKQGLTDIKTFEKSDKEELAKLKDKLALPND
jgi:hypothetical protein